MLKGIDMNLFLPEKQKTMYYNQNYGPFSNYDANMRTLITSESNTVIYDAFTCDVNFSA